MISTLTSVFNKTIDIIADNPVITGATGGFLTAVGLSGDIITPSYVDALLAAAATGFGGAMGFMLGQPEVKDKVDFFKRSGCVAGGIAGFNFFGADFVEVSHSAIPYISAAGYGLYGTLLGSSADGYIACRDRGIRQDERDLVLDEIKVGKLEAPVQPK